MIPQSAISGFAKRAEKKARHRLKHLFRRLFTEPPPTRVEDLQNVRRILLIRPNFRIGNAAISTPLISAFKTRFPDAQVDFLGTDSTRAVLLNHPVGAFHALSRRHLQRPWQFLSLLRRLRRNRYDLAVQVTTGSLTGLIMARLVKARYTMGSAKGSRRWFDLEVPGTRKHAYDIARNFARFLDTPCMDQPVILLTEAERAAALEHFRKRLWIHPRDQGGEFCAVFVGGHGEKRWSFENWLSVIHTLEENGQRFVVFLGPEERALGTRFREAMATFRYGVLVEPRPLREFCALLSYAQCLITPDSGPMHLAAGLKVPTITLVKSRVSLKFVPRGEFDVSLVEPTPVQVYEALVRILTYQQRKETVDPPPNLITFPDHSRLLHGQVPEDTRQQNSERS